MGLSAAATSAIAQAATTAASVGASFGGSYTSAKKSYKYYQKAFNLENERQDYLLANQQQIAKNALRRAGYSTADPNGTGVTPAQTASMQGATVQPPDISVIGQSAVLGSQVASNIASTRLTNTQSNLNDIEMKYRAELLEGQVGKLNAEIKQISELLPERINEVKANIANLTSQKDLNEKQASLAAQQVDNLAETLKGIKIDNKWKNIEHKKGIDKLTNEITLLAKEGRIKEAEAKLADNGIVLGAGSIGMLVSAALSGQAGHIADLLANSYAQILNGMPDLISKVLYGLFQGLSAVPKGLIGAVIQSYKDNVPDWVIEFFKKGLSN